MSAVRPSATAPGALLCPRCGNVVGADQSWCLECGLAARTRIHPPPSWRVPVLLSAVALALIAAAIAVGLVALIGNPRSTTGTPTTVTVPATTTPLQTAPSTPAVPTTPTVPATTKPAQTAPAPKTATPRTGGAPATGAVK